MTSVHQFRQAGAWIALIAFWAGAVPAVRACPVCFRIEEGPTAAGVRMAVYVLMAVTILVLAGAALFVARFVRRSAPVSMESPDP